MLANYPNIPCPHCGLKQLRRTWLVAGRADRIEPRAGRVTVCDSCRLPTIVSPNGIRRNLTVPQVVVVFPELREALTG